MTLDRSPEFCFKRLIYTYLLETGHALDDLRCGPCSVPRVIIGTYLNFVYQLMLHTKYQGSRPGGFRQKYVFMFSPYVSQCKKECMTRDCHTQKLHLHPRHREEESKDNNNNKNNNSLINSVTSRTMPF